MLLQQPYDESTEGSAAPTPPQAVPGERYLTRGEAAEYLGLPVSTVYQWARTGRLHCIVTLGGHLRFSKADLDTAAAPRPRAPRRTHRKPPPTSET